MKLSGGRIVRSELPLPACLGARPVTSRACSSAPGPGYCLFFLLPKVRMVRPRRCPPGARRSHPPPSASENHRVGHRPGGDAPGALAGRRRAASAGAERKIRPAVSPRRPAGSPRVAVSLRSVAEPLRLGPESEEGAPGNAHPKEEGFWPGTTLGLWNSRLPCPGKRIQPLPAPSGRSPNLATVLEVSCIGRLLNTGRESLSFYSVVGIFKSLGFSSR